MENMKENQLLRECVFKEIKKLLNGRCFRIDRKIKIIF
jgi:hypothetical protein